jgi:hypothetical protein
MPGRHALEIERSATATEDLHVIAAGADEEEGPLRHEDLIFIDSGSNEDLVTGTGVVQGRARAWIGGRIRCIDDQGRAAGRVRWRIALGVAQAKALKG